jgi:hypothetical protein
MLNLITQNLLKVVIIPLLLAHHLTSTSPLIPYGVVEDDTRCLEADEHECLNVPLGFTFQISQQPDLQVLSTINVLSTGTLHNDQAVNLTLAVLSNSYDYAVSGSVLYRSTTDPATLNLVNEQISDFSYFNKTKTSRSQFKSTHAFVATWANVVAEGLRNTFQAVLTVDSNTNSHFLIYNYEKGKTSGGDHCFFSNNSTSVYKLPSCGPRESNVGRAGRFVFKMHELRLTEINKSKSDFVFSVVPTAIWTRSGGSEKETSLFKSIPVAAKLKLKKLDFIKTDQPSLLSTDKNNISASVKQGFFVHQPPPSKIKSDTSFYLAQVNGSQSNKSDSKKNFLVRKNLGLTRLRAEHGSQMLMILFAFCFLDNFLISS